MKVNFFHFLRTNSHICPQHQECRSEIRIHKPSKAFWSLTLSSTSFLEEGFRSPPTPTPQETSMLLPFLGGEAKPQRVKRLSCHFGHCHQKKRPSKHIVTLNGVSYTARRFHYYYSITKLIWTRQKGKTIRFLSGVYPIPQTTVHYMAENCIPCDCMVSKGLVICLS